MDTAASPDWEECASPTMTAKVVPLISVRVTPVMREISAAVTWAADGCGDVHRQPVLADSRPPAAIAHASRAAPGSAT